MIRLSANLGFLWTDRSLPDAIRAAAKAGFEAVECHWPYDTPAEEVKCALEEVGLPMLGLNTRRGDLSSGENGVAALPGRSSEARSYVNEALDYAREIGTPNVHVMAGFATDTVPTRRQFVETLRYACDKASKHDQTILIEPLNQYDAPGYFLQSAEQASEIIAQVDAPNLKMMFDFYHLQILQGDVMRRLKSHLHDVGHIQIAAVPDRGEPDRGELDYRYVLAGIAELGWGGYVGAEYKPRGGSTDAGLDWRAQILPAQ